jgi:dihydrofolate reductase
LRKQDWSHAWSVEYRKSGSAARCGHGPAGRGWDKLDGRRVTGSLGQFRLWPAPTIVGRILVGGAALAKLIYIANTSLDGYTEDPDGGIDFGNPDEEYFSFINELERTVGTYLYGRRMYQTMVYWETAPVADQPHWIVDFTHLWRAADKVVFSKTLTSVSSSRTTVEQEFEAEAIRHLKASADHDLTVGGADLAAQAIEAGLVDECHLFFWPVVLGGGKPALPLRTRLDLELLSERRSRSGVAHLHYRINY